MHLHDIFVYRGILNQLHDWKSCCTLKEEVRLDRRLSPVRAIEHWSRLPRGAVQSSSSEVFRLYKAMSNLV